MLFVSIPLFVCRALWRKDLSDCKVGFREGGIAEEYRLRVLLKEVRTSEGNGSRQGVRVLLSLFTFVFPSLPLVIRAHREQSEADGIEGVLI